MSMKKFHSEYMHGCKICGRVIHFLVDPPGLAAYLVNPTDQRRAFQCINCDTVICKPCWENSGACICGSNAWIARPYLETPAAGSGGPFDGWGNDVFLEQRVKNLV